MADVIKNMADNLTKMLSGIDKIIKDAAERNNDELADIQTDQMQKGKNAIGGNIGSLRSPSYGQRKKNRGGRAPFLQVDLKNTGKFQRGVFAKVAATGILLDSSDSKTSELKEKYDKNGSIFGYNEDSKGLVREVLVPTIAFQIKRDIKYVKYFRITIS